MSGLKRMSAMRPNKLEYMSLLSKKENNPSSVSKNEMNAALKKYSEGEMGAHARMWNEHRKKKNKMYEASQMSFFNSGGKRRTKRHGKKRSTRRRHTRRQ